MDGGGFLRLRGRRPASPLRRWELAVLLAVALSALLGARLGKEQDALAQEVIRLHVVANSDSPADQAVKYKVRDALLREGGLCLTGLDRDQALVALERALPRLGQVAADTLAREGAVYPARLTLGPARFPTKSSGQVALPAGEYTALRVELGEAKGQNWWSVVFPPLCLDSVSAPAAQTLAQGGLEEGQAALLTDREGPCRIAFRAIELWEGLKARLAG